MVQTNKRGHLRKERKMSLFSSSPLLPSSLPLFSSFFFLLHSLFSSHSSPPQSLLLLPRKAASQACETCTTGEDGAGKSVTGLEYDFESRFCALLLLLPCAVTTADEEETPVGVGEEGHCADAVTVMSGADIVQVVDPPMGSHAPGLGL